VSFSEICIYQVKPDKVDEFETLMKEVKEFMNRQEGLHLLRFVKREYNIDFEQIKEGLPPKKLTRVVKSVRYLLYWEFETKEHYGTAQKNLYESYWKRIDKCLIVPHDKYLGDRMF
jgi:cobalamin biosynthesis Co2+ chelatase CbiK